LDAADRPADEGELSVDECLGDGPTGERLAGLGRCRDFSQEFGDVDRLFGTVPLLHGALGKLAIRLGVVGTPGIARLREVIEHG